MNYCQILRDRWNEDDVHDGDMRVNRAAILLFAVKHQHQRSERLQPAWSPLGVGRGPDAKTETGGERLVRPGAATVQLPATVRVTDRKTDRE